MFCMILLLNFIDLQRFNSLNCFNYIIFLSYHIKGFDVLFRGCEQSLINV